MEKLRERFRIFIAGVPTFEELGPLLRSLGYNPSDADLGELVNRGLSIDEFCSVMSKSELLPADEIPGVITRLSQDIAEANARQKPDGDYRLAAQIWALEAQIRASD